MGKANHYNKRFKEKYSLKKLKDTAKKRDNVNYFAANVKYSKSKATACTKRKINTPLLQ
jgi:hypothetical protein